MTLIVAPIFLTNLSDARQFAIQAHLQGADAIELRCDRASKDLLQAALSDPDIRVLKTIVTIRPQWEGGEFSGSEKERLELLLAACRLKPDLLDVEWMAWKNSPGFASALVPHLNTTEADLSKAASGIRLILSNHDFSSRPADLHQRLAAMAQVPNAAVLKVAFQANNLGDALAALEIYTQKPRYNNRPLVAIAMGEAGQISRLLAAKFAAAFTFASLDGHNSTAPGQPLISALVHRYRFKQQRADWRVFGVVGSPVSHSVSPMIHNAGFAHIDFPGVYVPLLIGEGMETFAQTIEALRTASGLNLGGTSITIPHKTNAFAFAQSHQVKIDAVSRHIGAINTLYFHPDGVLEAANSDAAGAIGALTAGMGIQNADLYGKDVAILGAGGAARAVIAGLESCHAHITIYNRTLAKAHDLAAQFGGAKRHVWAQDLAAFPRSHHAIIINCTSAGMNPHTDTLPFPPDTRLHADQVVFDSVYNPRQTRLLHLARSGGATCVEGLEMLLGQAAVQFHGFTGQSPPQSIMRSAALAALPPI